MPEGPSIVILKEEAQEFEGQKVSAAEGNSKVDVTRAEGKKILALKTWGKHFLICFEGLT
ncbi:endonuclease, partial [Staphylococcus aureus]|nr:endonuclease [Staphylococcus aureus]